MSGTSRRSFLGSAGVTVGAYSLGNISGCGTREPASKQRTMKSGSLSHLLEGIGRENIKITDIKLKPMSYRDPNDNMWRTHKYLVWKADCCPVEVYTDQGIVGLGAGTRFGTPKLINYVEEIIKPAIIGKNPFDVEFLTGGGDQGAWAGVDVALWDIIGKAKNMPVYKLLATNTEPDTHIQIYASGGVEHTWYDRGDGKPYGAEQLIEEALRYKEQGHTAFKLRPGTFWGTGDMTLDKYFTVLRKLREAVGPDFDLMEELGGWTLEECIELAHVLEDLHFLWFEQPIGGIENKLKLKEHMPTVMISDGEGWRTRYQAKPDFDRKAIDIVQTDCCRTGLTENWYIAHIAHQQGIKLVPHNWYGGCTTMSNAALVAAIPNRFMLEWHMPYNPFKEEIFKDPLVVKNGYMDLHDKPGFGMELIPGIEKKYPYIPNPFGGAMWSYDRPNPRFKQ